MNTEKEFHALKDFVRETGTIALKYFDSGNTENELKRDKTVVTKADQEIEAALVGYIQEHFPGDAIVGEEYGEQAGSSGFFWHIDPIDGTDNFLRKIPFFAISIARLGDKPEESFAIVYNPAINQMFYSFSETEGGVYENDRLCTLTPEPLGGKYVISIGRSTKEEWMKPATYALNEALGTKYGRCGAFNCTALEIAYVAANRIDAFLTYGLKSYDWAAGLFLVKATGGAISVFEEGKWRLWTASLKELCSQHGRIIFTSHPQIHPDMLGFIGDPAVWAKKT